MIEENHIVSAFDRDLAELNDMVARLGVRAGEQFAAALSALETQNASQSETIVVADGELDELEQQINERAIEIIAMRSPKATDLRCIVAALKVSSVLERIGDYAKNIAKRSRVIIGEDEASDTGLFVNVGALVQKMLQDVMTAYANNDAELAIQVWNSDQNVDAIHTQINQELLQDMREQSELTTVIAHFLFIAKNIERVGDHATSIAEQVHFLVHGTMPDDERPKADDASSAGAA